MRSAPLAGYACNYCRISTACYEKCCDFVVGLKGKCTNYILEIFERTNFIIFGKQCLPYSDEYPNPKIALWYRNLYHAFGQMKISLLH
jgi:hypothetical protein